jgi:tape measure domain-containing protein
MATKQHSVEWKLKVGAEGGQEITALQRSLNSLGQIDSFVKLKKSTKDAEQAWKEATKNVSTLAKELRNTAAPTKAMETAFERAKKQASSLKDQFEKQRLSLNGVRKSLQDSGVSTTKLGQAQAELKRRVTEASDASKKKIGELNTEIKKAEKSSGTLSGAWGKLAGAWVAFQAVVAGGGLINMIEDMQRLNSRLEISEGSAGRAANAMAEIKRIAQETGTPVRDVADAYIRFSGSIQRAGGSQQQSVKFTELLNKALKVSGANAEQAGTVMLQLGQAFESGRLQGDEFRSVAENGGKVLTYLADALGVTRGKLREMATAGELNVDALLKLTDAAELIEKDFDKLPRTVGDAMTRVGNSFLNVASESTLLRTILTGLALALEWVAKRFDALIGAAVVLGISVLIVKAGSLAAAITAVSSSLVAARVAFLALMSSHPILIMITAALATILYAWEDITKFAQKFETMKFKGVRDEIADMEGELNGLQKTLDDTLQKLQKTIDENRKGLEEAVKSISSAYKEMTDQVGIQAKAQIEKVQARYREEMTMIDAIKGKSDERHAMEADALGRSIEEQLRIQREGMDKSIALLDEEGRLRADAARRMSDNEEERTRAVATIELEILGRKRQTMDQILSAYKQHIDALNAEEKRHLDEVKSLDEQKRQLSMTAEEKIRSWQRSTMGEYQAYQDKIREIDENTAKARDALSKGNSDMALEYARKAMEFTSNVANSVTEDGKVVITQQDAVNNAIRRYTEAEQLAQRAMDARKTAHMQAAEAAAKDSEAVSTGMTKIEQGVDSLNSKLSSGAQYILTDNADQVLAHIQAIDAALTERERIIHIQSNVEDIKDDIDTLRANTESEHEIDSNAPEVQAEINRLKKNTSSVHTIFVRRVGGGSGGGGGGGWANGGRIPGYAFGGRLPGFSRTDNMLGMIRGGGLIGLAGGEDVTNALSSRVIYGAAPWLLPDLNKVRTTADLSKVLAKIKGMPGLATGGRVSESYRVTLAAGDRETTMTTQSRAEYDGLKAFTRTLNKHKLVHGS